MADKGREAKHILVVNDTEEMVELLRDILVATGHRVSGTTFAPEELAEVKKAAPDLVILDLVMGGENLGWQLLQKMKLSPDTANIPAIVCTAAADSVRQQEGWLASKGVKIVLKPFSLTDLERAVDKAFELPELVLPPEGTGPTVQ